MAIAVFIARRLLSQNKAFMASSVIVIVMLENNPTFQVVGVVGELDAIYRTDNGKLPG